MTSKEYIAAITPQVYQQFRRAIELGKWPDGRRLSDEQRATCMEAIITYEHLHVPQEERTGYIAAEGCSSKNTDNSDAEQALRWRDS